MKRNTLESNWRLDRLYVRTVCTEQWRHVLDSNKPSLVNTSVAKGYSHFGVPNVNKVDIFFIVLRNRINSTMHVVPFYVHFHYIDNAFMCTA